MTTTTKLASSALIGLLTAGFIAASPAFAGEHDKGACSGKSGCKGEAAAEKSECKGNDGDKSGCDGKDKSSCSGKSGCSGQEEKK